MSGSSLLSDAEHDCAEILAYIHALDRGGGRVPPYDSASAVRDFCKAAAELTAVRQQYPAATKGGLYEIDPLDSHSTRLVPTALRQHPFLSIRGPAAHAFDKMKESLSSDEYSSLLGHIWTRAPKSRANYDPTFTALFLRLFTHHLCNRGALMTPEERRTLGLLPNPITIYRGCKEGVNEEGLSWSLSAKVAVNFAFTWHSSGYLLREATCNPADIFAYFDFSSENEAIVMGQVTEVRRERINLPIPAHYI